MNFLDSYDITGRASDTPPPPAEPSDQSLNEEVNQVIGQLGRFWGGFRKQSQTVLETARKDLGDVVLQAQRELGKLTGEAQAGDEAAPRGPLTDQAESEVNADSPSTPEGGEEGSLSSSCVTETNVPTTPSSQTFFARLQSALPPNIASLPDSLKHASESLDLAQLRTHAEEYVHKSEVMLREAVKEAGEVLKDVVKIVPPEESGGVGAVPWDGTDMWLLVSSIPDRQQDKRKGKERAASLTSAERAVSTRAEALLRRLKRDPDIIKHDPEADGEVRAQFEEWVLVEVNSKDGGLDGPLWKKAMEDVLGEPVDGEALKATHDTLVPETLGEEAFWKRYFFRVHQIKQEEERRKALLQRSVENDELFSWEDDDEDASSPSAHAGPTDKSTPTASPALAAPGSKPRAAAMASSPVLSSPRESSEDSYDLVSSGNVSRSEGKPRTGGKDAGDGADSDWE